MGSKFSIKHLKFIIIIFLVLVAVIVLILTIYLPTTNKTDLAIINNLPIDSVGKYLRGQKQLIVIISLDGLGSDLINQNTPFLYSLLQQPQTAFILDMQTLEQSETMPAHLSMVTGLTQEHHKFYANSVDESTPPLISKTIFDYAIDNSYSYYAFLTKNKLLYLLGDKKGSNIIALEELSGDVINNIDNLVETDDTKVLVFIHLRDIDTYGHTYGWNSNEQKQALITLDNNLKLIVQDFRDEFSSYNRYFIFTADHGGEGTQHSNDCPACRRIPLIIVSENTAIKYKLDHGSYNIYDVTCVVLSIMTAPKSGSLDCVR